MWCLLLVMNNEQNCTDRGNAWHEIVLVRNNLYTKHSSGYTKVHKKANVFRLYHLHLCSDDVRTYLRFEIMCQ